jgi:pimeloyl-ACP methyl ester carboxylesterase
MRVTRRGAIAGAAAGAVVAVAGARGLPLRRWEDDLTGACGPSGPAPPRATGTRVTLGTLRSRRVAAPVDYAVGLPPGHVGSASAVCLPGRGSDARWVMDTLHVVDFVAAAGLGYAVAAVDGGESYWHRRASGEDRMAMLLGEFLPLLHDRFGLVPQAIMGWSMGGYGALLAAERRSSRTTAPSRPVCTRGRPASSWPAATTRTSGGGCCPRRCASSAATSRGGRAACT